MSEEKYKTDDIAPNFKKFGGIDYVCSYLNPTYARNCVKGEQQKRADFLRMTGHRARVVRVPYHNGRRHAYVIYHIRVRRSS